MTARTYCNKASSGELRGRDVLAAILAFFGVVFAVNGYFLYAALSTHTGVVAVEPYRKGLAYNDRIAAEERQSLLGWNAALDVDRTGLVLLVMTDRAGVPVSGATVHGSIGRPVTGRSDQALRLVEADPGRYTARAGELAPGAWIASFDVSHGRDSPRPTYRLRRRIWLKP